MIMKTPLATVLLMILLSSASACGSHEGVKAGNPGLKGQAYAIVPASGAESYLVTVLDAEQAKVGRFASSGADSLPMDDALETVTVAYTHTGNEVSLQAAFSSGKTVQITLQVDPEGVAFQVSLRVNNLPIPASVTTSSLPYLVALKDGEGEMVAEAGGLLETSDTFLLSFSQGMNAANPSPNALTLSCGDRSLLGTVSSVPDTDGIAENEFLFTPREGGLCPLTTCTLAVEANGLKSASGKDLLEEASFTFQTGDQAGTIFTEFSECYLFNNIAARANEAGSLAENGADLNVEDVAAGKSIKMTMTSQNTLITNGFSTVPSFAEKVSGDFTADLLVGSMTVEGPLPLIGLAVVDSMAEGFQDLAVCSLDLNTCFTRGISEGLTIENASDASCSLSAQSLFEVLTTFSANTTLRITRQGTRFRCYRRLSGESDFTAVGNEMTIPGLSGDLFVAVTGESNSNQGTNYFNLSSFSIRH